MGCRAGLLVLTIAVASGLGACAKGSPAEETKDLGGAVICPDHPALCSGMCCGSVCTATQADVANCGGCGVQCQAGTVCQNGSCGCLPTGAPCGTGQSCCGTSGCKSLMSDINNCGACGKACGTGSTCENGVCKCGTSTCASGETCCNGTCAATCSSAPDMAVPAACTCASGCPLSKTCVGPNCCFEDVILFQTCMPDPLCVGAP